MIHVSTARARAETPQCLNPDHWGDLSLLLPAHVRPAHSDEYRETTLYAGDP